MGESQTGQPTKGPSWGYAMLILGAVGSVWWAFVVLSKAFIDLSNTPTKGLAWLGAVEKVQRVVAVGAIRRDASVD